MIVKEELQRIKDNLLSKLNEDFDRLLAKLDGGETDCGDIEDLPTEYTYPFTADTNIFIGKKPVAVLFGEERVEVNSWRKVYAAIIGKCNADPKCHENLMYLRDKAAGRVASTFILVISL